MEMSKENVNKYVEKLQKARLSLMRTHPFYAVLLMHVKFGLDNLEETAYTDGKLIVFGPDFLEKLSDSEVQFTLMHEVMHIALDHCNRFIDGMILEIFNIACDIVVNSIILYSFNNDVSKITIKGFGEAMHLAPNQKEGYEFTAEEVYQMLMKRIKIKLNSKCGKGNDDGNGDNGSSSENSQSNNDSKMEIADKEIRDCEKRNNKCNDSGNISENSQSKSDNQSQMKNSAKEDRKNVKGNNKGNGNSDSLEGNQFGFDDHSYWKNTNEANDKEDWNQILIEAKKMQDEFNKTHKKAGRLPMSLERQIVSYIKPQTNWREILQDFIQVDIVDYSFNPPDRRMQDSSLILPDFNGKDENVKNIWFVVDTSDSITKKELTMALSEIIGALDQFKNHLEAKISFFDINLTEPKKFTSIKEFEDIKIIGGGGTSFEIIFNSLEKYFKDEKPAYIIVLTDGYAEFPKEEAQQGIPVLWLINNEEVTPPWGKVGRIKLYE